MKKSSFLKNIFLMSAVSLALRSADLIFGAYTAGLAGAEAVGFCALIGSVYGFAITLSASGLSLSVTKTVSAAEAAGDKKRSLLFLLLCSALGLIMSGIAGSALFFCSDTISRTFIKHPGTTKALRILALSLPFTALGSCFRGYLMALEKVSAATFGDVTDQAIRIVSTVIALRIYGSSDLASVAVSFAMGDTVSSAVQMLCYAFPSLKAGKTSLRLCKKYRRNDIRSCAKEVFSLSVPMSLSYYLKSAIVTVENFLIPRGLRIYSGNASNALSQYGAISGMALPAISYPGTVVGAFGSLLIPEASRAYALNDRARIRRITSKAVKCTLFYSLAVMCVFIVFGEKIGTAFYKSADAGAFLPLLAPALPMIYLDAVTDSLLKGLGEQMNSLKYNTVDAIYRTVTVFFLIPRFGTDAYIAIMISGSFFNIVLSLKRLFYASDAPVSPLKELFLPFFAAMALSFLLKRFL